MPTKNINQGTQVEHGGSFMIALDLDQQALGVLLKEKGPFKDEEAGEWLKRHKEPLPPTADLNQEFEDLCRMAAYNLKARGLEINPISVRNEIILGYRRGSGEQTSQ